jgi:hypothetical protein
VAASDLRRRRNRAAARDTGGSIAGEYSSPEDLADRRRAMNPYEVRLDEMVAAEECLPPERRAILAAVSTHDTVERAFPENARLRN